MNTAINLLKWPATVWLTVFGWFGAHQLVDAFRQLSVRLDSAMPVLQGLALYVVMWTIWLRRSSTAATIHALEHEFAHLLASIVTFNSVTGIEARANGEGHVILASKGNWIVWIAPYVLPVSIFTPALLIALSNGHVAAWWRLLGFSLGFHLHTTWVETHSEQTDLKKKGFVSAFFLLPACHIVVATWVCGLLLGNQSHLHEAARTTWRVTESALDLRRNMEAATAALKRVNLLPSQSSPQGI